MLRAVLTTLAIRLAWQCYHVPRGCENPVALKSVEASYYATSSLILHKEDRSDVQVDYFVQQITIIFYNVQPYKHPRLTQQMRRLPLWVRGYVRSVSLSLLLCYVAVAAAAAAVLIHSATRRWRWRRTRAQTQRTESSKRRKEEERGRIEVSNTTCDWATDGVNECSIYSPH